MSERHFAGQGGGRFEAAAEIWSGRFDACDEGRERAPARQTVPRRVTGRGVDARNLERIVGLEGGQDGGNGGAASSNGAGGPVSRK